jgi:hypothetical protein
MYSIGKKSQRANFWAFWVNGRKYAAGRKNVPEIPKKRNGTCYLMNRDVSKPQTRRF